MDAGIGGVGSTAPSSQPLDGGQWEACLCCCCCCPNPETVRIVLGGIISASEQ